MPPPLVLVVAPRPMLMLPDCASALTPQPPVVTFAFWAMPSAAKSWTEPVLAVVATGPDIVSRSLGLPVAPALSEMLPPADTPPLPMVSGLCATMDTEPAGALTVPVVTAPVLSTDMLPPLLLMPGIASAPVLVSTTLPLPVLVALKLDRAFPRCPAKCP